MARRRSLRHRACRLPSRRNSEGVLNDFGVETCFRRRSPCFTFFTDRTVAKRDARKVSPADPSGCDAFPRFGDIGYAKAPRASVVTFIFEGKFQLRAVSVNLTVPDD
jgi:hypothetical protein